MYSKQCCAVAVMQKEHISLEPEERGDFGEHRSQRSQFSETMCCGGVSVEDIWGRDDDTSSSYHSSIHVWIIMPAKH